MQRLPRNALFLALVAACGAASADEARLRVCRNIAEPALRLACYDGIPLPPMAAPGSPAPARPAPAPAPGKAAATPAPAAGAPAARTPESFGLEEKTARAAEAQRLDRIESHIPGRFEGWRPNALIRLANGQVWQVVDDSSVPMLKENPKVVVRRGVFSNFFMDIEGDNRSPRVRRVQ